MIVLWVVLGVAGVCVAILVGLWLLKAALYLFLGAVSIWPAALIAIVLGGLVFGPGGAMLGFLVTGVLGFLAHREEF